MRNVLKSASGADSPRIGALGIYGGSRHTLDACYHEKLLL